jgi:hypothetical protein
MDLLVPIEHGDSGTCTVVGQTLSGVPGGVVDHGMWRLPRLNRSFFRQEST